MGKQVQVTYMNGEKVVEELDPEKHGCLADELPPPLPPAELCLKGEDKPMTEYVWVAIDQQEMLKIREAIRKRWDAVAHLISTKLTTLADPSPTVEWNPVEKLEQARLPFPPPYEYGDKDITTAQESQGGRVLKFLKPDGRIYWMDARAKTSAKFDYDTILEQARQTYNEMKARQDTPAAYINRILNHFEPLTVAQRRQWFEEAIFRPLCKELGLPADTKFDWGVDVRSPCYGLINFPKRLTDELGEPIHHKDFEFTAKQMRAAVLGMPAAILTGVATYDDVESVKRLADGELEAERCRKYDEQKGHL